MLSNPSVHVCLMAPGSLAQFQANLAEIRRGPLRAEDTEFLRGFGDLVYRRQKYFM